MNDDNQIDVIQPKGTRSKAEWMLMRRGRASMERAMTAAMLDAEYEIARAFQLQAGHMGYASPRTGEVKAPSAPDEGQEWAREQIARLNEWQRACPSKWRGVVLDIAVFEFSVDDVAYQRAIHRHTVREYWRRGLNEFCKLRGWGDQMGER